MTTGTSALRALEEIKNKFRTSKGKHLIMRRDMHPLSSHDLMILSTIQGQANDEQLNKWI
ncbi:hypothetical protein KIN20_007208 [Parelaphostrongylus tenuis]|uniref:Acyl-coenzyme A oxidase N-terminal domain-containing protein n=1 Tax=Parelaphostrongylus tenuis TaxID=148309 RepID=A0AAD5MLU5_PARTN|nr:hypothetical protein KIN20_007208 [Parelaphostrongylus tenuis]